MRSPVSRLHSLEDFPHSQPTARERMRRSGRRGVFLPKQTAIHRLLRPFVRKGQGSGAGQKTTYHSRWTERATRTIDLLISPQASRCGSRGSPFASPSVYNSAGSGHFKGNYSRRGRSESGLSQPATNVRTEEFIPPPRHRDHREEDQGALCYVVKFE